MTERSTGAARSASISTLAYVSESTTPCPPELTAAAATGVDLIEALRRHGNLEDLVLVGAGAGDLAWAAHPIPTTRVRDLGAAAAAGATCAFGIDRMIAGLAWGRRFAGNPQISICGVLPTIPDQASMSALATLPLLPLGGGDALICCSRALFSAASELTARWLDYQRSAGASVNQRGLNLVQIPLGIHVDRYEPNPRRIAAGLALRESLGFVADDIVVLVAENRADEAASAIAIADAGHHEGPRPTLRLLHASDHGDASWHAADMFLGLSTATADCVELPTLAAMAAGLPAIVSDWGAHRDIIFDGEHGRLVPTSVDGQACVDLSAAASMITDLALDRDARSRMGQAAAARVRAGYSWRAVIAAYESLWAELSHMRSEEPAASRPPRTSHPHHPDPFELFASYPSSTLSGEMAFRLADADAHFLLGPLLASPLHAFSSPTLLGPEQIHVALTTLGAGPRQVAELRRIFSRVDDETVDSTLLWLYKYGLIAPA